MTLHNVPRIGDVGTMLQLLTDMGVTVHDEGDTLHLCARDARFARLRPELFQQIRGSMLLAGPHAGAASAGASCRCPAATASAGAASTRTCWRWKRWARRSTFDHYDFKMRDTTACTAPTSCSTRRASPPPKTP